MVPVTPESAQDLAGVLKECTASSRSISVIGNNSKHLMAGPVTGADKIISTTRLNRVLQYEPNDLTVSVEAGIAWATLQELLAQRRQMIALDPPFSNQATVGGVVASNSSGPLRKNFGTARDLVIGMQFAMLDGKLVRSGGMVVKNVAGLDMGKLLIGSFGTLAVLTSVNFRLHAIPEQMNTFLFSFPDLTAAIKKRDALLASILRPLAMDVVNPPAAVRIGHSGYLLAARAGGSSKVLDRYARELTGSQRLTERDDDLFWTKLREFSPDFLRGEPSGVILRASTPLSEMGKLMQSVSAPCLSRAGSGVTYVYLNAWQETPPLWKEIADHRWAAVTEFAPNAVRSSEKLWQSAKPDLESSFDMMKSVKQMFDPANLLNRSRLYGRI